MAKRKSKAIVIGKGRMCKRCHKDTERRAHNEITEKLLSQPYYYKEWDYCKCGFIQHYEAQKVINV